MVGYIWRCRETNFFVTITKTKVFETNTKTFEAKILETDIKTFLD